MQHYRALSREQIRDAFAAFCAARPVGGKFAHRATDGPAGSSPSMKWVNPPVAYMLHADLPLLLDAGVYLPGLMPPGTGDAQRVALESYPGLLARYPHEFSGGQRQRLAIARALIVQPQVLVLDEPTSALDVTIQQQVLSLLQRLQKEKGLSYLLITHDVDVIRAMAHEVLVMKDGEVLESGSVGQVLDAPQHPYTQRLVAAATVPGAGPKI